MVNPPPGAGVGVEALAEVCGALAWVADSLFVLEGRWSSTMETDAAVELLAVNSRLHGWHATLWQGLLPDSPALRGDERVVAPPGWESAMASAADVGDDADDATRLVVLYRALLPRTVAIVGGLADRAIGPGDAAVARIVGFVESDHARELQGGLRLLTNALGDEASVERAAGTLRVLDRAFANL